MEVPKPKAVVVGGSIAGVSCAHALLRAGWDVVLLDKSSGPPVASATGAGLSIESLSCRIIASWLGDSEPLSKTTVSLTISQCQVTDAVKNSWILTRDEDFNLRAGYWSELHFLLRSALPQAIFLWGHLVQSFCVADDKSSVMVKAQVLQTGVTVEITGDLLVAADGSMSSIRQAFLPDHKLRYAGFCVWRGVYNFSENEDFDTIKGFRKAYPDLGNCQYYELGPGSHSLFYEVLDKRVHWILCLDLPEPDRKSLSSKPGKFDGRIFLCWQQQMKFWLQPRNTPFFNDVPDILELKEL